MRESESARSSSMTAMASEEEEGNEVRGKEERVLNTRRECWFSLVF